MNSSYATRRFLCGILVLALLTGTVAAEELYRYTPPPDKEHNTFAAIAYSESTGKWGYAYDCGTGQEARRKALKFCKANDAQVLVVVGNMSCALALGDDKTTHGLGTGSSAALLALRSARKVTTNCYIAVCVQSKYGKTQ
jgi:hypothetical protein